MRFVIDNKKFIDALSAVALRGRYPSGGATKLKSLSNYAYIVADMGGGLPSSITLYNANDSTACSIKECSVDENSRMVHIGGEAVLDIPKMKKYLKPLKGLVTVTIGETITLDTTTKRAKIPSVLDHPSFSMIQLIRNLDLEGKSVANLPTFGKANVQFEAAVMLTSESLQDACATCDVSDTARYVLEASTTDFKMGSPEINTEKVDVYPDTLTVSGEEAVVELTGEFAHFLKGITTIYLKDDFPVLITSPNRVLIKAPRFNPR